MFKKILVALDCNGSCESVFNQGLLLAQATQSSLSLLTILEPRNFDETVYSPYESQKLAAYIQQYKETELANLNKLQRFSEQAREVGIESEFMQTIDSPGRAICQSAESGQSDLIVVGSRGRTGLREMLLGSVSNYVVHHAPCSVMVIHERA